MKIKAEWTPWAHDIRAAPRVHFVTTALFQGVPCEPRTAPIRSSRPKPTDSNKPRG